jgi:hypothetical protein
MKIYFSPGSDPMLLESLEGMNSLHEKLIAFLASSENSIALPASSLGSPEPYQELLGGLEVLKGEGPLSLSLTPKRWLRLAGAPQHLAHYLSFFHFEESEEGCHHHREYVEVEGYIAQGSISLLLEVDSEQE